MFVSKNPETKIEEADRVGVYPKRITARHIEPGGIGYNQGYSTLEVFLGASPNCHSWTTFLDLRGHAFNNGKLAANGGIGVRYWDHGYGRIWGINGYYDYRDTKHLHYNQVALGLETLGKIWDARINGYLPVGKKSSNPYGGTGEFSFFSGHYIYIQKMQEFAMKGANGEVGVHVDKLEHFPFYAALGPYYLEGKGEVAWGGQLRAVLDLTKYARVEGNVSWDKIFR